MSNILLTTERQVDADQVQKILQLLQKAQALGLNFDIGSAYIRREYINQQTALNAEIDALLKDYFLEMKP